MKGKKHGAENKKQPMSASSVGRSDWFMSDIREESPAWATVADCLLTRLISVNFHLVHF